MKSQRGRDSKHRIQAQYVKCMYICSTVVLIGVCVCVYDILSPDYRWLQPAPVGWWWKWLLGALVPRSLGPCLDATVMLSHTAGACPVTHRPPHPDGNIQSSTAHWKRHSVLGVGSSFKIHCGILGRFPNLSWKTFGKIAKTAIKGSRVNLMA